MSQNKSTRFWLQSLEYNFERISLIIGTNFAIPYPAPTRINLS